MHLGLDASVSTQLAASQCGKFDTVEGFDVGRGKTGSWVTTTPASCVARAFDYAVATLIMQGALSEIEKRWFGNGQCEASSTTAAAGITTNAANGTSTNVTSGGSEEEKEFWGGARSIELNELSFVIFIWASGLVLTGLMWMLPGSHDIIEHGRRPRGLARMPTMPSWSPPSSFNKKKRAPGNGSVLGNGAADKANNPELREV